MYEIAANPHRKAFGSLLICSGNPGLKSQRRLGDVDLRAAVG